VVDRVIGKSKLSDSRHAVFVVRRRVEERNPAVPSPVIVETDHHLSSGVESVLLHAAVPAGQEPPATGKAQRLLVEPPSKDAVTQTLGGLEIKSSVASQTHEGLRLGAVEYKDCLRVHMKGLASGSVAGAPATGSVEETTWYAKGIGIVKVARVMKLDITVPNEGKVRAEETMTRVLERSSMTPG
jgi:hypothetical protein